MWKRPLPYVLLVPCVFMVGAGAAITVAIASFALSLDAALARWIANPVALFAMMAFVHWSRTDERGNTRIWPP